MPLFTILLPTYRNAHLLPYAIQSVLCQTITDFELFVICDGATPETIDCANQFEKKDKRVKVFSHTKGERHGELYRHMALQQAKGQFVAHICDDDLWFPNHLEEMILLLNEFDFGNIIMCCVDPRDDTLKRLPGSLLNRNDIKKMLTSPYNFFGPTVAGYTMHAYKKLAIGWSPAPLDVWTDLFMWRKFLGTPGLKFGTRQSVTACHFASPQRKNFSAEDRKIEITRWFTRIQDKKEREKLAQEILDNIKRNSYQIKFEINI